MGAVALALQQAGDIAVAILMRSMGMADYAAQLLTARGAVYAAMLALFLLMPWLVRGGEGSLRQIKASG